MQSHVYVSGRNWGNRNEREEKNPFETIRQVSTLFAFFICERPHFDVHEKDMSTYLQWFQFYYYYYHLICIMRAWLYYAAAHHILFLRMLAKHFAIPFDVVGGQAVSGATRDSHGVDIDFKHFTYFPFVSEQPYSCTHG